MMKFACLTLGVFLALPLAAQDEPQCIEGSCFFDRCHTPAHSVPAEFWGEMEPADAMLSQLPENRDNTDFDRARFFGCDYPYFEALDVENGWLFVVTNRGFQIWDATGETSAGQPVRVTHQCTDVGDLHPVPRFPNEKFAFTDVDAPEGVDSVVATTLIASSGVVFWDTANKAQPAAVYQHVGFNALQVYSTTLEGNQTAFVALENGGLAIYDMTASLDLPIFPCVEEGEPGDPPTCPGVFLGHLGERRRASYVDGATEPATGRQFIVFSGDAQQPGVEIWEVTGLGGPLRRLADGENLLGVALWWYEGAFHLAVQAQQEKRIYRDRGGCLTTPSGECSLADLELVWQGPRSVGIRRYVTDSVDIYGTPFLHFGTNESCATDENPDRLYDVTDPSTPRLAGSEAYWSYYYRTRPTGFNWVAPRMGKFAGDHFYRAGFGILDAHRRRAELEILDFSAAGCSVRFCTGTAGEPLPFHLETSGPVVAYDYDWQGDGTFEETSTAPIVSHAYPSFGVFQPVVRVRDALGGSLEMEHAPRIIIFQPPMPGPPPLPPMTPGREQGTPGTP